ncbi:MAG: MarR family winged helix-turn-helix transcriptional regulator [Cryomorphaceae bacterium]|nr:MarR family transcriptional regulator [Flavobacteriales bacterium]
MKPEKTIDFHLRWLWLKIIRIYNTEAAKFGGTMSVGYVLLNIDRDGTPSTKLGPKMGIESRSLTRTLKSMEERGLIYKTRTEGDGRLVLIHLTEEGIKYRETSRKVVLNLNEYLQGEIPEEKLNVFFEVSEQINTLLDNKRIFKEENQPRL